MCYREIPLAPEQNSGSLIKFFTICIEMPFAQSPKERFFLDPLRSQWAPGTFFTFQLVFIEWLQTVKCRIVLEAAVFSVCYCKMFIYQRIVFIPWDQHSNRICIMWSVFCFNCIYCLLFSFCFILWLFAEEIVNDYVNWYEFIFRLILLYANWQLLLSGFPSIASAVSWHVNVLFGGSVCHQKQWSLSRQWMRIFVVLIFGSDDSFKMNGED